MGTVVVGTDYTSGKDRGWVAEISENGKIRTLSGSGREQFLVTGKEVVVRVTYESSQSKSCLFIYEGDKNIYISNSDWIEIDCQVGVDRSVAIVHDTWYDFFTDMCCLGLIGLGILTYQQKSQTTPVVER